MLLVNYELNNSTFIKIKSLIKFYKKNKLYLLLLKEYEKLMQLYYIYFI